MEGNVVSDPEQNVVRPGETIELQLIARTTVEMKQVLCQDGRDFVRDLLRGCVGDLTIEKRWYGDRIYWDAELLLQVSGDSEAPDWMLTSGAQSTAQEAVNVVHEQLRGHLSSCLDTMGALFEAPSEHLPWLGAS